MKLLAKSIIATFAIVGALNTITSLSTSAFAQEKQEGAEKESSKQMTAPVARISPVQAMKAASANGGKATMAIFEFDEGHWVYGVVVVKNHKLMEIDVDPITGKVGDSEVVTPDGEAKEMSDALSKMAKG